MKVVVIGATGTLGRAVVAALEGSHDVTGASRGDGVDLAQPSTFAPLLDGAGAVVCCAASAPLTPLAELAGDGLLELVRPKLLGQAQLVIEAMRRLQDGGSITLTSGAIPEHTPGSAGGALVNAGLEAFVRAAAPDLDRGLRLNAVSPGWVAESLENLGLDPAGGTPAATVAVAYVEAVEGDARGEIIRPG
jgi:NAD(P)-dependent dehydrogenase (short-subunit alcohol dehydrogenase family)